MLNNKKQTFADNKEIYDIKKMVKYIISEGILWIDEMTIVNYTGVKGLYLKPINESEEEIYVIEDNTIYNINFINKEKLSLLFEIIKKIYFETKDEYCTKKNEE